MATSPLFAQQVQHRFAPLSPSTVPTPNQLTQRLQAQLGSLNLNSSFADRFKDMSSMLDGMDPEQIKKLMELGQQFQQGDSPEIPDDLRQMLERKMQDRAFVEQLRNMEGMQDLLPNSGLPSAERIPGVNPPKKSSPQPNQGRTRPPVNPRQGAQGRSSQPSNPNSETEGYSRQPQPNRMPNGFDPSEAERLTERFLEQLKQNRSRDLDLPDLPEENPFGNPTDPVGNRFDRMILEAINNRANSDPESTSRFMKSLDSAFEGVAGHLHETARDSGFLDSLGSRGRNRRSGFSSRRPRPSVLGGVDIPTVTTPNNFAEVSWVLLAGMGVVLLALLTWLGLRVFGGKSDIATAGTSLFSRRFRIGKIKTPGQLVQAVDGYLLSTFGKPSSWWHSRRAESALLTQTPSMDSEIAELVDVYEYIRYSEVGNSISENQITQGAQILKQLVAAKPQAVTEDGS